MKKYRSHKVVWAAPILKVNDEWGTIEVEGLGEVEKPRSTNYWPAVGDYLVEYEDRYRSISPKKAFEDGYTEIEG